MTSTLNMIVIKHFKQELGRSVLDICLDKELPNLLAVLPLETEKLFYPKFGEKNLFRSESDHTETLLLDVMKHLRTNKWNLLTSNSFAHLSLEKTVESHFYFERVTKAPGPQGSIENTDDDQVDDEKMKAFTSFLRHQFQEYEKTKAQMDRRQFSQDPDHPQTYGSPSHAKNGVTTAAKPTTVPPEVLALILEKTTQPSGPYAFAKRASGAGVSPLKRPIAPEVSENFSKAQREALEVEAQQYQQQLRLQQQQVQQDEAASLPPLPPSDADKRTGPAINSAASNRLVQKYQPVRKSISGVTPRLDLSSSELSHEADVSNFYEAKNDIVEFNPLHGSTPRGTTPRGTTPVPPEATVAAAPSPVPVSLPAAQTAVPTPLPSPSAAPEPTLTRQPSAADKLLSKYRRKSSFTLNKNAGPSATTTALGIAAKEELLKDVTAEPSSSSEVTPVPTPTASSAAATATDNTTLAAAAAAAAAKRSSLSSAFPVITEPTEISSVPSPASPTANGSKITADAPTPKKRTSFFALQNGSSRDLKAVLEASTASVETNSKSVGEQEVVPAQPASVDTVKSVEQVIPPVSVDIAPSLTVPVEPSPKPATSVIEVGAEIDKKVTEEQKKSPSSTPTSAAAAGRSSFLSRYQPKKRSITGTSSNNLKADLQKEMSTTAAPEAASSEAAPTVTTETPAVQVELPSSHSSEQKVESPTTSVNVPAKVEQIEPVTVEIAAQSKSTVPAVTTPPKVAASDDILSSLPDIPQSISDQLPSTVPIPSQRTVPLPPPPEAESVIAILAAQSTTAHNQSLHSIASDIEVKVPFASSSIDELADVAADAEPVVENTATVIEASQPANASKDEEIPVSPEPTVSVASAEDKTSTANEENLVAVSVSSSGPNVSLPLPEPVPEPVPEPESAPIVPTLQEVIVPSTGLLVSSTVVPVDPVPVPASPSAPFAPVTEQSAEGSATVSSATAAASTSAAPAPTAAHPDGFEVEYAGEKSSISSSVLMRQIAQSKQNEENPEMQQHESEKTSHYSKLGSAFVTSNALGRGGRGGGRGRGRGL